MESMNIVSGYQVSRKQPVMTKVEKALEGETYLKAIRGTYQEVGYSVAPTSDGGEIAVGKTNSFFSPAGGRDYLFLTRISSSGDLLWARAIRNTGDISAGGYSIVSTSDGGFAAVGSMGGDLFLTKYDSMGNLLWAKTAGGANADEGFSVIQTSDNGFITVGLTDSFGAGNYDLLLTRFNSSGDLLWSRTVGGTDIDKGSSIIQASDDGFVAIGSTNSFGAGNYDFFLTRFDSSGVLLWAKTIGGMYSDEGHSIASTSDGGFIVTGKTGSYGAGGYDLFVIRFNSSGNLLWAKTLGGANYDHGASIIQTSDDGFVAVGGVNAAMTYPPSEYGDLLLARFNSSGDLLWAKSAGEALGDAGLSVSQSPDGNFVVTGTIGGSLGGTGDLLIAKFDASGNIPDCDHVESCSLSISNVSPTISSVYPTTTAPSTTAISITPTVSTVYPDERVICEGTPINVEEQPMVLPQRITLSQNSPNPFNGRTQISYTLALDGDVSLDICDISGKKVSVLEQGWKQAGTHQVVWETKEDMPSGVYICQLKVGNEVQKIRMTLIK